MSLCRTSKRYRRAWILIVCSTILHGVVHVAHADDSYFFEQVVPLFQRRCIGCHNDAESKGGVSLQSVTSIVEGGYIEPHDPEASRLLEVVLPADGVAEMPKDADPLTPQEIGVLRHWIQDGAKWPTDTVVAELAVQDFAWWSLQPLARPRIPSTGNGLKIRNPIDAFISARLTENGLTCSTEADRTTLIRRLTFDLIGLPPTTDEIEAFLDDTRDDAYERLVDRLLDSAHYGERWARHWLDVVHYADTHGYDKDKLRPNAWPYRDYVIRSLNADKPYSRFVREQIAGDELWPYSADGITATGFISAGPWDFIGHAEVPETKIDGRIARHLDRDDMVSSTMNTFVSTTVQCARCHNHKFDPVTQEHYYSLQAVFAALDRADRNYDANPEVAAQRAQLASQRDALAERKDHLDDRIRELGGDQLAVIDQKLKELEQPPRQGGSEPAFGYHSQLADDPDTRKWVQVDLGAEFPIESIELIGAHDDYAGIGAGFGFPLRFRIETASTPAFDKDVQMLVDQTQTDFPNPGVEAQAFPADGIRGRFVRVTADRLASRTDAYFFALGELRVITKGNNVALAKPVTAYDSIEAPVRWRRENLVDGKYHAGASDASEADLKRQVRLRDELLVQMVPTEIRTELYKVTKQLRETRDALDALPEPARVYAGTIHHGSGAFRGTGATGGKPRTIHVLHRGDILQPRQLVGPGRIPVSANDAWQFELPADHREGERRVALANWIASPDNPLTWRSIVNRVWHYHFGRGIVETPNDFGRMGAKPSHPMLLDWLAVEFRDHGQSLKQLHRLIVTSSAYRQSSAHDEANAAIDSGNKYLWRMNRRRLSAEEVRDAVLQVSGKLDKAMYGPAMQLFELERTEHSPHYEYHKHDPSQPGSHRRSIYRFIVRSQPDPFMTTLDCADSSQSVPRRTETVTPLQALSLMNNRFMLVMAENFAERVEAETASSNGEDRLHQQVRRAYRIVTGRLPSPPQANALVEYTQQFGLKNTCRLLCNLNEFVFID